MSGSGSQCVLDILYLSQGAIFWLRTALECNQLWNFGVTLPDPPNSLGVENNALAGCLGHLRGGGLVRSTHVSISIRREKSKAGELRGVCIIFLSEVRTRATKT